MKKYDAKLCKLIKADEIKEGFFDFTVEAPELAANAKAGQFAHIKVSGRTLRRPISICEIDKAAGTLRFVFQVRGAGTEELASAKEGDFLDVLAPLGNGFPLVEKGKRVLLIGGGIGVPPLLSLADYYSENSVSALGFRTKSWVILEDDFKRTGTKQLLATDDGTYGEQGFVTDLVSEEDFDVIYSCGPLPMLKNVAKLAKERDVPCYVSLEERMACGVGACLGCAVKIVDEGEEKYLHVCKDGPVFDYRTVVELL